MQRVCVVEFFHIYATCWQKKLLLQLTGSLNSHCCFPLQTLPIHINYVYPTFHCKLASHLLISINFDIIGANWGIINEYTCVLIQFISLTANSLTLLCGVFP